MAEIEASEYRQGSHNQAGSTGYFGKRHFSTHGFLPSPAAVGKPIWAGMRLRNAPGPITRKALRMTDRIILNIEDWSNAMLAVRAARYLIDNRWHEDQLGSVAASSFTPHA